ncbi:MAG: PadR family transcriptional regulator [Mycoplasmatales bacterium]
MQINTEMLKGILEGCVLEIINKEETYGYNITKQLNNLGFEDVVDGTVYTILLRFEKRNLVAVNKKPSAVGPPRKFFKLTTLGQQELQFFWKKWEFITQKLTILKEED